MHLSDNNEAEEQPRQNVFRRAGNAVKGAVGSITERANNAAVAAQSDIQANILQMIIPHVKRMIPGIEQKLKNYLLGFATEDGPGDGIKKAILMKLREDGKIEIMVFNAEGIAVEVTEEFITAPESVLLNMFDVDEYVLRFLRGNFDNNNNSGE
jgi:hypothetical protein